MGRYIVNGEYIDLPEEWPTARDLKKHSGGVQTDWLMANMPNGEAIQLAEDDLLPEKAADYSTVVPHTYGIDETQLRVSRLRTESYELGSRYGTVYFDTKDGAWFYLEHVPLAPGWNRDYVSILIDIHWTTPGYPHVAPEWFWTDQGLETDRGRPIGHFFTQGSHHTDKRYLEKGWGHFCVHLNEWRPKSGRNWQQGHSLVSYVLLIESIFRDQKRLAG